MSVLLQSNLPLPLFRRGKVRDVYSLGDKLLVVSTDRISAFDAVLPCGIPDKGKVLNQLSAFWFESTAHIMPNHLIKVISSLDVFRDFITDNELTKRPQNKREAPPSTSLHSGPWFIETSLIDRSMIVAKAKRIPVECIVRGYLSGSAWAEYKKTGKIGNIHFASEMKEGQELPQPIFTPTTKSDTEHDRPLTEQDIMSLGIEGLIEELERKSLLIYQHARGYAKSKGIIIADTKFEFGLINDRLVLIDELLTPDSSRFWDASHYEPGHSQLSFDKQPVRDWLLASGWNKEPPAPTLPPEVIEATTQRYDKIYKLLTDKELATNVSS